MQTVYVSTINRQMSHFEPCERCKEQYPIMPEVGDIIFWSDRFWTVHKRIISHKEVHLLVDLNKIQ